MRYALMMALLLLFVSDVEAMNRRRTSRVFSSRPQVSHVSRRPDLAVTVSDSARLKIVSRKSTYRNGEMIRIDIALLNSSESTIYLKDLSWVSLEIREMGSGRILPLTHYMIVDRLVTAQSFKLLKRGQFIDKSYDVLVGCDPRAFEYLAAAFAANTDDETQAFDQGQFINFGQGCLKDLKPGSYAITATLKNNYVVVSSNIPKRKTAVGSVASPLLTISVVN